MASLIVLAVRNAKRVVTGSGIILTVSTANKQIRGV
jgi:hypothetical protein